MKKVTYKRRDQLEAEVKHLKVKLKDYEDKFKAAKTYLDDRLREIGGKDD